MKFLVLPFIQSENRMQTPAMLYDFNKLVNYSFVFYQVYAVPRTNMHFINHACIKLVSLDSKKFFFFLLLHYFPIDLKICHNLHLESASSYPLCLS